MSESIKEALKQIFESKEDLNKNMLDTGIRKKEYDPPEWVKSIRRFFGSKSLKNLESRNLARSGPLGSGSVSPRPEPEKKPVATRSADDGSAGGSSAETYLPDTRTTPRPVPKTIETGGDEEAKENLRRMQQTYRSDRALIDKANPIKPVGTTTSNLRMGSRGNDVKALQRSLGLKDDGIFGPKTDAAVKAFQQKQGLKTDSIAGDQTMSAIRRMEAQRKLKSANPMVASTLGENMLNAFDKVITSKHSNIFQEAKSSAPKTAKEKELAALAEPKDKITHKDVLVGRGVVAKEEKSPEEYDVTGSGVMTYTDPKTGEKKDYIPDIHMKGYKTLPTKNIPVPTKRPKKMDESIFSEAELAYFEGVGKIAGKPNDKSVPAGKDTSNATGSRSGTLSDEYVEEGRRGRPPKGESLGANELHMNAKRAADNMNNITHTFANGQKVKMTKAMGAGFLARHLAAKTPDEKDALLNHAHSSLSAFKDVVEGKPIPEKKKKGISLAGNM